MIMSSNKPLNGIKVVELSTYVAAPACGRMLADWGADVIKVESDNGDVFRIFGKGLDVPADDQENPLFDMANAGKKSIVVNLKTESGIKIMHDLIADADVFLTNNRIKALGKIGLDYETLKEKYPRLVYAIITGFGDKGPEVNNPGFDTVAFWASGGFLADLTIDGPGSYPVGTPAAIGDISCGTTLFGGVMAALYNRERTGLGDRVTVSLFGAAVWFMGFMNTIAQKKYGYKYPRTRYEGNPVAIPYKTKDGEWIMTSILEYERYFPSLCKVVGVDDLAYDPRFINKAAILDPENRKTLVKIFEERFATKTAAEWIKLLTEADIVHDRLKHLREIADSEQAIVNNFMSEFEFSNGEKAMLPRPALQSYNLGTPEYLRGPLLGEDTSEVLQSIGYDEAKINDMIQTNIVKVKS
jgi:crotonobetainyl-CoA:carnitine CoA-transferase CaiB-like acyl-CoA transferase